MAEKFTIRIDSVLGGETSFKYFSKNEGQFTKSLGIDPDMEATVGDNTASGFLVPVPSTKISSATITAEPLWQVTNPKDELVYVYDQSGKVYSVDLSTYTVTALNSGNALSSASGNGAAYYDNYIYFAKNADICRYGPLNGAVGFTENYWTSSLSLTAPTNTTYPAIKIGTSKVPNHPMHVHVDDKLYFGDVTSGNLGIVSYIKTSKASVEGDTNNGSTYNALDLGQGIWPTALESYGTDLVIAGFEGSVSSGRSVGKKAKLYFWDTIGSSFQKEVELPDPLCSALLNVNGILYAFTGNPGDSGVRVLRFIGGYTFEEVGYLEDSQPPFEGAVASVMGKVLFGGYSTSMGDFGCLYALGSKVSGVSTGLFTPMRATATTGTGTGVLSIAIPENTNLTDTQYFLGWRDGTNFGIDRNATTYGNAKFISGTFRIGKPFVVEEVHIPLAQAVAANMNVIVKIVADQGSTSTTMGTINSTNYSGSERNIYLRQTAYGKHDLYLDLRWTSASTSLLSIGLPITISGEYIE